jgi:ABC-type siderophore export system fused ATPase/permease subunit
MKALLNLLALLDDQEIVRVVREWNADQKNSLDMFNQGSENGHP